MRVVLDTNVLLSGILWGGLPAQIIEAWRLGKFQVVVTHEIFAEYQTILKRFAGRHQIDVDDVMQSIAEKALWCAPMKLSEAVCSDPDDDKFIAAAIIFTLTAAEEVVSGGSYGERRWGSLFSKNIESPQSFDRGLVEWPKLQSFQKALYVIPSDKKWPRFF